MGHAGEQPAGSRVAAREEMRLAMSDWPRRSPAVAISGTLVAIVACDIWIADDPQARVFPESVQRLAGTMVRAAPSARAGGDGEAADQHARLAAAMSAVEASRIPLLARLPAEFRASVQESA